MTDPSLVARKLSGLSDHLQRLRTRKPADVAELRANLLLQDAIALSLLVVVQEAIDIAFHVGSDEGWGVPSSFREAFEMLAHNGVIDDALATALANAANLRNRIAHGYATVDVERVWAELPAGIASFEAFAKAIAAFLQRAPSAT